MMEEPSFAEQLRAAPERPGVYLFRDAEGRVLYIGKARNLRRRVQVYRRRGADGRFQMAELLARAVSVEWRVTDHEIEAVLLEDQLVKRHQPPLNLQLRDDKAFLLVHLDSGHRWPRLGLARRRRGRGEFFGPFGSAWAARRTKRLLMQAFGLRDCSDHTLANRSRPCLKHGLGLCSAPCVGLVEAREYRQAVERAREVLQGRVREPLERERRRMEEASARQEYETALRARDRMRALEALAAPQKVRLEGDQDFDVAGIDERGQFAVLEYRGGEWIHTRHGRLPLRGEPAAMYGELVPALYRDGGGAEIPPRLYLGALPEEHEALEAVLSERAGHRVRLLAPARGEKRALVRMAEANARARAGAAPRLPWPELAARLGALTGLPAPAVVDCVDLSHLQGRERVASRVRFVEGRPEREAWRRFLVGGGVGNDDFAGMAEVVGRLLRRAGEEGLPDLLVLDGGRGQLEAGMAAAREAGFPEAPLAALAKARRGRGPVAAEERLFLPGRAEPVILERGSPERLFLERVRDEAHRFALSFHRSRRENVRLILEQVPGIGAARRKQLLDLCGGDLQVLRGMDPERLAALPGMRRELAERVLRHLEEVLP